MHRVVLRAFMHTVLETRPWPSQTALRLDGKVSTVVRSEHTVWEGAQAKVIRNFAN